MKDSFILYLDQKEIFGMLEDEEAGQLIKAIFEYEETGQMPKLDKSLRIAFIPIKNSLDRNKEKYQKVIERNKQNIEKRWNKENTTGKIGIRKNTKNTDSDNEHVNEHENENNIYTPSEQSSTGDGTAKASKHRYGEYKHVLLKDEELQALQKEYANWEELIKYLDEYIEMKGYKAKSHYLCIKKWVVEAVKKMQISSSNVSEKYIKKENKSIVANRYTSDSTGQYDDLSKFYIS